ncbi:thioredoxin [Pseudocolwellia agarivorans]|mgnify:CR=1 FL=1|uniref:thioredoxin n=1 Tax=Pseudocolwellia agarivorans TaxID=1911682 RepID=UPI00098737DD|nr:thioredoxin [Pseudocolwellia agarivorans]
MNFIEVNDDNFESEVIQSTVPVLVDFWAPWCMPCKQLAPVLAELADQYQGKAKIVKINTEESPATAAKFGVRSIPNVFLFNEGEKKLNLMGLNPKSNYEKVIDNALTDAGEPDLAELLKDDEFRTSFVLTSDIESLQTAVAEHPEIASKLLSGGVSPVSAVLDRSINERVHVLLSANPELSFIELAGLGKLKEVESLLADETLDVNQTDINGTTAFWLAARHGQYEVCKLLIDNKADIHMYPKHMPVSAVALVASRNSTDLLKLLIEHGADIHAKGHRGESLLHMVTSADFFGGKLNKENIQLLLDKGLNNSLVDNDGNTPLQALELRIERYGKNGEKDMTEEKNKYQTLVEMLD